MKKLLALVLALVMTMSLVTISSADFKDADKIDYNEAVDVMNAVGVFIGDDNGNFNPKANLERAQAAKIVAYLLLGNKTAEGLAGSGKFTDVAATNWAAGFIDYCAATGVVAGVGNGKFDPNGSLTTLQFAKMLLVALGYDAKIEGFTGNDWSINVSAKANQVGLLDGLDVGANAALTREQAAKMALNTLKSPLVEYDTKGTTVTVGGDASVTVGASKAEFKTSTNKKAQTIDNSMINGTTAYTVEFAEEYYSDLKLNSDTTDDFGRPCVEWFWKADSIGVYSNSDDLVATYTAEVTAADIYTAVGKSVSDDVNSGKAKLTTFIDGVGNVVKAADAKGYVTKNDSTTVNGTGNGDYTEVYVNDDNDVTIVTVRTYVFQATTDYNAKKDTVTLTSAGDTSILLDNATLDGDDFDIKDIKADDYILVTASTDGKSNKYTVQSADVAEVLSGEVTGYKVNSNVTVGGTTYKYSSTTVKNSADTRNTQYTVGQNAAVVLDKYGYIIAVDKAVVSSNYVYVSEFAQPSGLSNGKVVASAYFPDGTTADITVKEAFVGGAMTSNKAAIKAASAGWYTYSSNSANEYSLYAPESKYTQAPAYSFSGNNKVVMYNDKVSFVDGQTLYANNDTIVIVDDGDSVSVYTGVKNIPDIKLTSASSTASIKALAKSNNYAYYVFVRVNGSASIAGNEDSALVYYVKYDGQFKTTDNKIYYTYKVLDANGKEEVVKADTMLGNLGSGDIYDVYNKARVNNDNELTSVDRIVQGGKYIAGTSKTDAELTYTAGALTLDKSSAKMHYTLADDAKITLVVKKSANELNKNKAADYEATVGMTGKTLGDTLKDYKLSYSYAGKVTDTDGSVISELFVTVTAATSKSGIVTPPVGPVVAGAPVSGTMDFTWTTAGKTLTITTTDLKDADGNAVNFNTWAAGKTDDQVASVLKTWLEKNGYTNVSFKPGAAGTLLVTATKGLITYTDYVYTLASGATAVTTMTIKINGVATNVPTTATAATLATYGAKYRVAGTSPWNNTSGGVALVADTSYEIGDVVTVTVAPSGPDKVVEGKLGDKVSATDLSTLGISDANSYVKIGTEYKKASELTFVKGGTTIAGAADTNLCKATLNGAVTYGTAADPITSTGTYALIDGEMKAIADAKFAAGKEPVVVDGYFEVKTTGLDGIFGTSLVSVTLDGTESYKLAGADKFFAKKDAEVKVNVTLSNFTDTSDTSVDVANGTYGDIKGVTEPIGNSVPTLDSTTKITFKANMVYSGTFTVKATVPAAADLSVNFS
mgnify:CR=1 FL=1